MTVRIRSGLERLILGVKGYFAAHSVTAAVSFGSRARFRQDNQGIGRANRVVFYNRPGRLVPPQNVGPIDVPSEADPTVRVATVRALNDWERSFLVSVWARDNAAPTDDLLQALATEALLEWTIRAVHATGFHDLTWSTVDPTEDTERGFGDELLVSLQLTHPMFDVPDDVGYPDFTLTKAEASP